MNFYDFYPESNEALVYTYLCHLAVSEEVDVRELILGYTEEY